MYTEEISDVLGELTSEFAGWRFGRGGSGHWWAVRRNDFVRALSVDELRSRLCEYLLTAPAAPVAPALPVVPVVRAARVVPAPRES
jgi:hypothetical protein